MTENGQYLSKAREKYQEEMDMLEATEGFSKLTDRQQQTIRVFMLIQSRVDRTGSPTTKFVWHVKEQDNPYRESYKHISSWNCHAAVASLENDRLHDIHTDDIDNDFFDADYHEISSFRHIKELLEEFGFPCVVHASLECSNDNGADTKEHTFLVLGHNKKGEVVVWEKMGFNYPYQIISLKQEYSYYGRGYSWGVRRLKNTHW